MSKIKIEDYKGQTIYYDETIDKFVCDIELNENLKNSKRGSLKDIKNEIKTFIKLNEDFKPFKIINGGYGGLSLGINEITAKRTDGKFVVKNQYGNNSYMKISDFNGSYKYFEYDYNVEKDYLALEKEYNEYRESYNTKKKEILKNLKPLDMSVYE